MRFILLFIFFSSINLNSQIELSNLFSDNMVLQQESHVNFWGKAQKNQELLIYTSWSGNIHKTTVNNNGNWKIKIKTPIILAPMAGVTDYPFRVLCKKMGAGAVYSEFVSSEGIIRENQKTLLRVLD